MKIATSHSEDKFVDKAVRKAYDKIIESLGDDPNLILAFSTVEYNGDEVYRILKELAGDIPIQGGTSCVGITTEQGFHSVDGRSFALWAIMDEDGFFGVGEAEIGDDPKEAAEKALKNAQKDADMIGELPTAVWLTSAPSNEEMILEGLTEKLGDEVCLIGGSSADNTIEGKWKQFSSNGVYSNAVTLAAFFLDSKVSTAFHSGYDPTNNKGVVTESKGRRIINKIDDKPASQVYNEWTNGAIASVLTEGGNILENSNLFPLGRQLGKKTGVTYYILSHPETVTPEGAITLFTNIQEGDEITCMQGSVDNLVHRVGNVTELALKVADFDKQNLSGALIIFCAGCMLTIGDRMNEAIGNIKKVLGDNVPFLAAHTFGEQGNVGGFGNCHGNLMISALLFGSKQEVLGDKYRY